jgi:hypothetical protein
MENVDREDFDSVERDEVRHGQVEGDGPCGPVSRSGAASEPPAWTPPAAATDPVGDATAGSADATESPATAADDAAAAAVLPETDAKV